MHHASTAEFNFFSDPEAAHIVLEEMKCPIVAAPWELYTSSEQHKGVTGHLFGGTKQSLFLKEITKTGRKWLSEVGFEFAFCDEIAAGIAIDSSLVLESKTVRASVELTGSKTRGQIAVSWSKAYKHPDQKENVTFVTRYDTEKLELMMCDAVN